MTIFDKLSPKQLAVFEQIAIGNDGRHHPRTIGSLIRHGLIESYHDHYQGDRGFPFPVHIIRYRVPVTIHIEWCAWCVKNCSEKEIYAT